MTELWDLYDRDKKLIGKTCERRYKNEIPEGLYHLSVWVFIVTFDERILLTQRAAEKSRAFLWEPVGGCVVSDENVLECAVREVQEEISLNIYRDKLELFYKEIKKNEILEYYRIVVGSIDIDSLSLQKNEVQAVKLVDIEELIDMEVKDELVDGVFEGIHKMLQY